MYRILVSLLLCTLCHSTTPLSVLHFTISRRGGPFPTNDVADFDFLTAQLAAAEARFNLTRRDMHGNKVVRKPKERGAGSRDGDLLMGEVGRQGNWFAKLEIGEPLQIHSSARPHPLCRLPQDIVHLPTINTSAPLAFAHCQPSKASVDTLLSSGSMLGLTASESLSQTKTPTLMKQLLDQGIIEQNLWSLMFINGHEGVLSLGGTAADAVDMVQKQTEEELDRLGNLDKLPAVEPAEAADPISPDPEKRHHLPNEKRDDRKKSTTDHAETWKDGWKWSKVQGARGWWQILMQGVWVDGSRVLQNQPVIIDINTPFILAPPAAAKAFYASIPGARPVPHPHDRFHVFPCLNPPPLAFEFGGRKFPVLQGSKGIDVWGPPGGKFSLGKISKGSGFCVGAVVESRTGMDGDQVRREEKSGGRDVEGSGPGMMDAGNGLRDVWVLGEGFFRGVGGVFDFEEQRVGLRTY
ncbi:MAG: hypothetical protein M1817_004690 [Caeruleum heppii]|nr:MAG: hypothetical protein M1817_004690 [Caeruleum heppii]